MVLHNQFNHPMIPQQITHRYVNRLLTEGRTPDFDISTLSRRDNLASNEVVGHYYEVTVIDHAEGIRLGVGATPIAAVRRALVKFGVTFR